MKRLSSIFAALVLIASFRASANTALAVDDLLSRHVPSGAVVKATVKLDPPQRRIYGLCECAGATLSESSIALELKEDGTFTYVDGSDPAHKQNFNGTWKNVGGRLLLVAADGRKNFHRKWKYVNGEKCIRARYQLNFRRICLQKAC